MTIDERLEKLAERHEALSQTVELLAQMHRENEAAFAQRYDQIAERHAALAQTVELLTQIHRDNETFLRERFSQMADAINRLAHIAEIHDGRLDDHQQRLDDLEK